MRHHDRVVGIVEHKDASEAQRRINEINTGILVANGVDLKRWLARLDNNNAQGEFYITDIIAMAHQEGRQIAAVHPERLSEVEGLTTACSFPPWNGPISSSRRSVCCWLA